MLTAILRVPALRLPLLERDSWRPTLRMPALRRPAMKREHMLASFVLATVVGLYLLAGLSVLGLGGPDGRAIAKPHSDLAAASRLELPAALQEMKLLQIAPQDAVAMNAAVPISGLPNPAARPFGLYANSEADRLRAVDCLTKAIYY